MVEKVVKYRLHTKGVFLTYPKCPAPRESILQMLESKGLIVVKGIVGQEKHKDGDLHLHAYVKFDRPVNYFDPHCFDITWDNNVYHGDYKPAKSAIGSIKYITKEDENPLELGDMDYKQEIKAKESKTAILGKRLIAKTPLVELVKENPEMLKDFKKWELAIEAFFLAEERNKPDCKDFIPNNWDLTLPILSEKKRHYWFWSSQPDKGKTTFLRSIDEQFRASWYNKSEVYQAIHKDSQFILIDEFTTADLKSTWINQMCDGTYQYPTKGGKACMCRPIILVCGNKHPEELYPKAWPYFQARFNVFTLDDGVL